MSDMRKADEGLTSQPVSGNAPPNEDSWGKVFSEEIRDSKDPIVRLADSIVYGCAIVTPHTKDDQGLFSNETYVKEVRSAVEKLRPYFPPASQTPNFSQLVSIWPVINRFRGKLISSGISGGILPEEEALLDALQVFADWYLETVAPRDTSVLEKLEKTLATPASTARTDGWEKALRELADCGDCDCDHDDENCCAKLHIPCAQCTSAVALAEAGITDYIGDGAAPGSVPQAPDKFFCEQCKTDKPITEQYPNCTDSTICNLCAEEHISGKSL